MKLFHKGILLIVFPMIGQFVATLILLWVHHSAEEQQWKDMHYRTQTQELMGTTVLLYKAIGQLSVYGMANQVDSLQGFDKNYEQLQRKVELLVLLDKEHPSKTARKARETLSVMMKDLYATREMLAAGPQIGGGPSILLLTSDLKREIEAALDATEMLIAERSREGLTDLQLQERTRQINLGGIAAGFALTMTISAALLLFFSRDFANRFEIVLDNARRVPEGRELNEFIEGDDELAYLDKTFHEMDVALKAAEARKQQLMNMVSHDLRGPLTAVQIVFELLLDKRVYEFPEKVHKRLSDTEKQVRRLSRLVNDVLDFDKLKVGKLDLTLDVVGLDAIIIDCIKEMEPILNRDKVSIRMIEKNIDAIADRERLPQIIINLLSNAVKFSPQGSEIVIDSSILETHDSSKGDFVKVSIQDSGPGVPEIYRETIFLPFEQVPDDKRPKKGSTGLGLPICKMLVERHGGQVGVEVPASGGSIFWFTLPLAALEEL